MILYDFSSLLHRCLHTSIKNAKPHKENGKYITSEFINLTIHKILDEILSVKLKYSKEYGNIIICMDDHKKNYWRKEIYPRYKSHRKKKREESEINYSEVFKHLNILGEVLDKYTQFKCIMVDGAEADDIICVLTRRFCINEKILILSPDKDFKQLHKFGDIKQYSNLTNDWVTNEYDSEEDFEIYHPILGDKSDDVPRITTYSKFNPNFKEFLESKKIFKDESEYFDIDWKLKDALEEYFEENFNENPFEKVRFGISSLKKGIKEHGSLENFINSKDIYRKTYEMNCKLVLDSKIPPKIEIDIIDKFNNSSKVLHLEEFKQYLSKYNLKKLFNDVENILCDGNSVKLTVENCGW